MSCERLLIPPVYLSKLNVLETQVAIKVAREEFEQRLARNLDLLRVSAPLFVRPESGLNDNLNGVERPVQFDVMDIHADVQVVQSLAKWKRLALKRYGIQPGKGLYTDMNAIRRDEELDNLHSCLLYTSHPGPDPQPDDGSEGGVQPLLPLHRP